MELNSVRKRSAQDRLLLSSCAFLLLGSCGLSDRQTAEAQSDITETTETIDPVYIPDTPDTTDENLTYSETLTIRTSDPSIRIMNLSSPWGDISTTGLGTAEASYVLTGDDHGIECTLDQVWISTSDGQHFSPKDNICDDWTLELDVSSPPFEPDKLVILTEDMIWQHHSSEPDDDSPFAREFLSLSIPETDAGLIFANCNAGSGWVDLRFNASISDPADYDAQPPAISIAIGMDETARLFHFQSDWAPLYMEGAEYKAPSLRESIRHPAFEKLSSDYPVLLMIEGEPPVRINHQDTTGALESFMSACLAE